MKLHKQTSIALLHSGGISDPHLERKGASNKTKTFFARN